MKNIEFINYDFLTLILIVFVILIGVYILNRLNNSASFNIENFTSNQFGPNGGTVQFNNIKNLSEKPVIAAVYYVDKEGKIQTSGKNRIRIIFPNETAEIEGIYEKDTSYLLGALTEDGGLKLELKGNLQDVSQKTMDNNLIYASFMSTNYNRNKIKTENDIVKIDKPSGTKQQTFIAISGEIV